MGNLGKINKEKYENYSGLGKVGVFGWNTVAAGWNGIASTWNEALDGKTGGEMLNESFHEVEEMRLKDLKRVDTWENIGGMLLTAYATKRIGKALTRSKSSIR